MKQEWKDIIIAKYKREKDKWRGNAMMEGEIQKIIDEVKNAPETKPGK